MLYPFTKITAFSQSRKLVASVLLRSFSSQSDVPSFETLAVSVPLKHVFHVELNRPKKLNAFSHKMWFELKECFSSLSDNPECRVVVLSGQGKHFTAGIDLQSFVEKGAEGAELDDVARKAKFLSRMITDYQCGITALEQCVKPVLSVVHSACVGAGVDLITAADIRYCSEDAWFQVKEVDIGLAADVGTLQRLPKVIGSASTARELCLTARKLPAKEAFEIGLVSKVLKDKDRVDPIMKVAQNDGPKRNCMIKGRFYQTVSALSHALSVAEEISLKSPVAVQTTKQSLVYSQSRTTEEGLEHIRLLNQVMLQSEDLSKAAIASATKGDRPEFDNL